MSGLCEEMCGFQVGFFALALPRPAAIPFKGVRLTHKWGSFGTTKMPFDCVPIALRGA